MSRSLASFMYRTTLLSIILGACGAPSSSAYAATFQSADFGTQVTPNVMYGTGEILQGTATADLFLDLYEPTYNPAIGTPVPASSPGIVLVHGGGFHQGDKADLAYLAEIYASYGYRVASINYRLGGPPPTGDDPPLEPGPAETLTPPPLGYATVPLPDGLAWINAAYQDSIKAMTWMRDSGAPYGIDTDHVAIGGYSAGAITSLLEAYNDAVVSPPASARPTAVMSFMGNMYGSEVYIDANDPPAFILNGDADPDQYYPSAVAMVAQMNTVGVYNEFLTLVGGTHTLNASKFDIVMPNGKTVLENNVQFLANYLVPEPSSFLLAVCGALGWLLVGRRYPRRS